MQLKFSRIVTRIALAAVIPAGAILLEGAARPASAAPIITIDGQSCLNLIWREESLRTTPTKRGRKRALRRARRQWARGVADVHGRDYANLSFAREYQQGCTQQGVCHVTARPCADEFDKGR